MTILKYGQPYWNSLKRTLGNNYKNLKFTKYVFCRQIILPTNIRDGRFEIEVILTTENIKNKLKKLYYHRIDSAVINSFKMVV